MVRSMLKEKALPNYFLGETMATILYILNKCPTKRLNGIVPDMVWNGHKSSIKHLKVFRSLCYKHVPDQQRKFFLEKNGVMILVGYHPTCT